MVVCLSSGIVALVLPLFANLSRNQCNIKEDMLTMRQSPFQHSLEGSQSIPPKHSILVDTDIGDDIDDALALALILRSPEIDLRGITTVFGDTQRRARPAQQLLHVYDRGDGPIAAGGAGAFQNRQPAPCGPPAVQNVS